MRPFTQSAGCRLMQLCGPCRERSAEGTAFRESLARAWQVPADAPDFACPRGVAWGLTTLPVSAQRVDVALGRTRLAACRRCDEYNGNVCEIEFRCGACFDTFQRWLNGPSSGCPHPDGSRWSDEIRESERLDGEAQVASS